MSSKGTSAVTDEPDQQGGIVPKLRFPEFQSAGHWQPRKLNELLSEPKQRNRSLKYGPEHVLSVSGEFGCVNQIEFMGRSYAGASVKEYHIVETGEIVYTKSPLKACPNGIIKENKGTTGIVSVMYAVYRPTALGNAAFLDHYFSSDLNLNSYLQPLVKKGPKNSILVNNADVLRGRIYVPSKQEQQKIADCLSSVDTLIAAEVEKLEALKDHKKGLMQQLFPAPGETTPRFRFSNAAGWNVVGLPTVAFFQEGPGIMAVDFRDDGVPLVRLAGVSGPTVTLEGCNYLDPTKVNQKWQHFRLSPGDLIISTSATFGLVSAVDEVSAGAVFYTGLIRFRSFGERLSHSYLKAFLGSPPFARQTASAAVGGGIKHFGPTHLKLMKIPLPSLDEQENIANCIDSVDSLITAQIQKVEALKVHKQGLIQKLFPVADQVQT